MNRFSSLPLLAFLASMLASGGASRADDHVLLYDPEQQNADAIVINPEGAYDVIPLSFETDNAPFLLPDPVSGFNTGPVVSPALVAGLVLLGYGLITRARARTPKSR